MPRIRVNALSPHDGQQENDVDHYQVRNVTQGKDLSPFPPGIPDGKDLPYFVEYSDSDWSQGDEVEVRAVDTDGNVGDPISFASAYMPVINAINAPDFVSIGSSFTVDADLSTTEGSVSGTATYQGEEKDLPATFVASGRGEQEIKVIATEQGAQKLSVESTTTTLIETLPARHYQSFPEGGVPYPDSGSDGVDLGNVVSGTPQRVVSDSGKEGFTGAVIQMNEVENSGTGVYIFSIHFKLTADEDFELLVRNFSDAPRAISNFSERRLNWNVAGNNFNARGDFADRIGEEVYIGFEYIQGEIFQVVEGDGFGEDGRVSNPQVIGSSDELGLIPEITQAGRINGEGKEIYEVIIKTS